MNRLTNCLGYALLVSCLISTLASDANAQRYTQTIDVEGGIEVVSIQETQQPALSVRSVERGSELCRVRVPQALFGDIAAEFRTGVLAQNDDATFVTVTFARGRVVTMTHEVVLRIDADAEGCEAIWQSSYSAADAGERVEPWPPAPTTPETVALVVNSSAIAPCGPERAVVQARAYNSARGDFVETTWEPVLRAGHESLRPAARSVADRFSQDGVIQYISSDASSSMFSDPRAVPTAISDGDRATFWREGVPGPGRGSFVGGLTRGPVDVQGVRLQTPEGEGGTGVSKWLLRTAERDFVLLSEGGNDERFILPESVDGGCFILYAMELAEEAETIAIGELTVFTDLDTTPLETVMTTILDGFKEGDGERWTQNDAVYVLGSGDEEALVRLANNLPNASFRPRAVIVEALATTESGRNALLQLIRDGQLTERELERIGQVVRRTTPSSSFLVEALESASPEVIDSLLQFLVESVHPEDATRLIPWAGHPAPAVVLAPLDDSPDIAEGLGRANVDAIGPYLSALNGRPGHDADLLRAIVIIAKREGIGAREIELPTFATTHIRSAIESRNGTVARLGFVVAGHLRVSALIPEIIAAAKDDPHPEIRSAAIESLRFFAPANTEAADAMVTGFSDRYPTVRLATARAVRTLVLDDEGIDELADAVEAERWDEIRRRLLLALAGQSSKHASVRLVEYLEFAPGDDVRDAMIALQNRRTDVPGRFLVELYHAHEGDDRTQVAILRTTASSRGYEMEQFLQRLSLDEEAPMLHRETAIESLGRARSIRSVAEMLLLLEHENANLRRAAARALAFFPDVRVERALERRIAVEDVREVMNALQASLRAVRLGRSVRDRAEGRAEPRRRPMLRPDDP